MGQIRLRREEELTSQLDDNKIPLLVGSGIGVAAKDFLNKMTAPAHSGLRK